MKESKTEARGVGLYSDEWIELEKIAKKYNTTLHGMAVYGLRYFIKEYKEGRVEIVRETKIGKP